MKWTAKLMAKILSYELKYSLRRRILAICCFYEVIMSCSLVDTASYPNPAVFGMCSGNLTPTLACVRSGKSLASLSLFPFFIKGRSQVWLVSC